MNEHKILTEELKKLLLGGSAHISLKRALEGLSPELRGVKAGDMPHSIWQMVEHIRIAQWDMLRFCKDASYKSPKWPEEYWPKDSGPADEGTWAASLKQINADLDEFIVLMEHSDIYRRIPQGSGQTVLREALQIADHNAYHVGEIVAVRRFLGDWK